MPETTISKTQSETTVKNRNIEIFSLTPSTLITLWEIDASILLDETGLKFYNEDAIFRFHNSIKLTHNSIIWRKKQYIAIPIRAEGFEHSAKGTTPTPKLSLSVSEEGISALTLLRSTIRTLGDLTGVKVTRRRVFAKYIDGVNFGDNLTRADLVGQGFSPDSNMQFEPDIYFIDRKSLENKSAIEFELGSITDIEGIKLPGRIINSRRCPFSYRGEGCLYEYRDNRVDFIHGLSRDSILPEKAPPVASYDDELMSTVLGTGTTITEKGIYVKDGIYNKGESVWIQKDGIKYYFVARQNDTKVPPPNPLYWIADVCGKTVNSCKLRWDAINNGYLPWGGFPSMMSTT